MQQVMTKTATTTETMKIKTNFLSLSIKCLAKKEKCSIFVHSIEKKNEKKTDQQNCTHERRKKCARGW